MKRFLMALAVAASLFGSMAVAEESAQPVPDASSLAAARDLLEVTGVSKQMDGMIDAAKKGFNEGAKAENPEAATKMSEEFDAIMKKFLSYKEDMMVDFAQLYAETFTVAEMKEVADFYRSGTGAKFVTQLPMLMQKGADIGMKYSEKMLKDMQPKPEAPEEKK